MFRSGPIEIWNLTDDGPVEVGPQPLVPIVGRIHDWRPDEQLTWRLDDGEPAPAFVSTGAERLSWHGDFAIDGLLRDALAEGEVHELELRLDGPARSHRAEVKFRPIATAAPEPSWDLAAMTGDEVEQIVQVIEGRWSLETEPNRLRIEPGDEGYDRIIAFGRDTYTGDYLLDTTFTIDGFAAGKRFHAFGLLFKWRPHRQGDGTHLPRNWTSGLGIFSSTGPGLAIRYGEDVHYLPGGIRVGNTVVGTRRLDALRWAASRATVRSRLLPVLPQLPIGTRVRMSLEVEDGRHRLSIETEGRRSIERHLEVEAPEPIETGCVGFMAAWTAVTVEELRVSPLTG
ncbi:MAG: hypothetical protein AAGD18_02705 [Actinomycetota bacterium]